MMGVEHESKLPLTLREHVAAALLFAEHGALWSEAEEVGETKEWLKSADVALNAIKAFPRDDSEVNKMSDAGVKALCAGVVPHDEIVSMHIDLWDRIVKILTTEQSNGPQSKDDFAPWCPECKVYVNDESVDGERHGTCRGRLEWCELARTEPLSGDADLKAASVEPDKRSTPLRRRLFHVLSKHEVRYPSGCGDYTYLFDDLVVEIERDAPKQARGPVEVTDEMLERAERAWYKAQNNADPTQDPKRIFRAAIEAALNG